MSRATCDGCGRPCEDRDECLCRKCKPSLMVKAAHAAIDDAFGRFCVGARALPPSMAVPWAYEVIRRAEGRS